LATQRWVNTEHMLGYFDPVIFILFDIIIKIVITKKYILITIIKLLFIDSIKVFILGN